MKDLIKDYLENKHTFQYKDVQNIYIYDEDKCYTLVDFSFVEDSKTLKTELYINIWEVLSFVNNKKSEIRYINPKENK